MAEMFFYGFEMLHSYGTKRKAYRGRVLPPIQRANPAVAIHVQVWLVVRRATCGPSQPKDLAVRGYSENSLDLRAATRGPRGG